MHGVKYTRMVGDGDSSIYRKLREVKPYGNQLVEKVECRNHLLRNFSGKIREVQKRTRSFSKNLPVPCILRKVVESNAQRLRTAVTSATLFRIKEDTEFAEKVQLLTGDLINVPSHVFGEHEKCAIIKYFACKPKENERNLVSEMRGCGLYEDIEFCFYRLIHNVQSLLLNMDNNAAEHYNSQVCKFVGGKRVNFSLRGGYQQRCEAAVLSFNTGSDYYRRVHRAMVKRSPQKWTRKYIEKYNRKKVMIRVRRNLFPKKKFLGKKRQMALPDSDYGPNANVSVEDMEPNHYLAQKEIFFKELEKTDSEILQIEINSRGQSKSKTWHQERYVRITASNFKEIVKKGPKTSCEATVKKLLYSSFRGNKHTQWGSDNESNAIAEFELEYGVQVTPSGFFIDKDHFFLGASPDGLINSDEIIEVKCPSNARHLHPRDAIKQKVITFAIVDASGNLLLKNQHKYYYQVQGQLAITKRKICNFIVWTPLGCLVQQIERDKNLWEKEMVPRLKIFYFNCLLPELIDPRVKRGLKIRNTPRDAYWDYSKLTL